jgi:raffinose/stachyose/melibiose transport system permease protein
MIALALLIGSPLYYVLVNTFKSLGEMTLSPLALPSHWSLDNYAKALADGSMARSFANTFYVTAIAVVLQLLIGSMASYAMIMRSSRLNRALANLFLVGFVIPTQSTLIPLYLTMVNLRVVDTLNGLILMYMGGSVFSYFLIQGYMRTLPFDIIEAARVDGAGSFQTFWHIVLPLIKPILITVGVFQGMFVWNDFLVPNVMVSSKENRTVVLQVYAAVGQFTTDWPLFMTITVIALVPMVVFFVLMQKRIVSGLLAGSIKG